MSIASTMPSNGRKYAAFISYRHKSDDAKWAKWLHRELEIYKIPKPVRANWGRSLKPVFLDKEELNAAPQLLPEIEQALRNSHYLIVVCSAHTRDSEWIAKEIDFFRTLGREDRILALLVEGDPEGSFPEWLAHSQPKAADVRPREDESSRSVRRMAKLEIVSGIIGCPLDELRRRDQERRTKKAVRAAVISVAFMMVMGLLAAFAEMQRQRAASMYRLLDSANNAELIIEAVERMKALSGADRETNRVAIRQAVDEFESNLQALQRDPKMDGKPEFQAGLAHCELKAARFAWMRTDAAAAVRLCKRAATRLEHTYGRDPVEPGIRSQLRNCYSFGARSHQKLRQHADAARLWKRVLELEDGPIDKVRLQLAYALVRSGEPIQAVAEIKHVVSSSDDDGTVYGAAAVCALASGQIRKVRSLATSRQQELEEEYATMAVRIIRQLVKSGATRHPDIQRSIQTDTDLDAIRGRSDFQELLKRIEADA